MVTWDWSCQASPFEWVTTKRTLYVPGLRGGGRVKEESEP